MSARDPWVGNTPIITLSVDRMKYSIQTALSDYQVQLSTEMHDAIDRACQPERIHAIVDELTRKEIDQAIASTISQFFKVGDGAKLIEKTVIRKMKENIKMMDEYYGDGNE